MPCPRYCRIRKYIAMANAERGSIPRKMPAYDKRTATFLPLRAALLSLAFVNKGDANEKERLIGALSIRRIYIYFLRVKSFP